MEMFAWCETNLARVTTVFKPSFHDFRAPFGDHAADLIDLVRLEAAVQEHKQPRRLRVVDLRLLLEIRRPKNWPHRKRIPIDRYTHGIAACSKHRQPGPIGHFNVRSIRGTAINCGRAIVTLKHATLDVRGRRVMESVPATPGEG